MLENEGEYENEEDLKLKISRISSLGQFTISTRVDHLNPVDLMQQWEYD